MELDKTLQKITDDLRGLHGDKLEAVLVYGSAARGDYSKQYSDINLIVVVKDPVLEELEKASELAKKWVKAGNPPPLYWTREGMERSVDVFPLEFLDIRETHRTLFGSAGLNEMDIPLHHARRQCERELKTGVLHLREQYLLTGGKVRDTVTLLIKSASNFFALFRGILRILGDKPPTDNHELVKLISAKLEVSREPFEKLVDLKAGAIKAKDMDLRSLFHDYYAEVESVSEYVDRMEN